MVNRVFEDEPKTIELLQSTRVLLRWLSSVPRELRQRFLGGLAECSGEVQNLLFQMVSIVENPRATPSERRRALAAITDALLSKSDSGGKFGQDLFASADSTAEDAGLGRDARKIDSQEAAFAERLRELMAVKCVTQQELSDRAGCSQPAISQLLNRTSRPRKKTILKLAEALQVQPQELWPELDVAEMLDAVADFQEDDHIMTEAEAKALRDAASRNVAKIPVRSLPARKRSKGSG